MAKPNFRDDEYRHFQYDLAQPTRPEWNLPASIAFRPEISDPWEMTIATVPGTHQGNFTLQLPGKAHQSVRFRKLQLTSKPIAKSQGR